MEGGKTKNIWQLERKAFFRPYVEIPKLHKIVQSSHECKWFHYRWGIHADGHPIIFESEKLNGEQLQWLIHEKSCILSCVA